MGITPLPLFIKPFHADDRGNTRDMSPPVTSLRDGSQFLIMLKHALNVVLRSNDDAPVFFEQDARVFGHLVSSVTLRENVPASLLIADTRWPEVTLYVCTQFAGRSVPAVELTAAVESTIAIRQPPVDDVDPGKLHMTAYVSTEKAALDVVAPPTDATATA